MRLTELLHTPVLDADGQPLGQVVDVRLVRDGATQGTFGAAFTVQGLIVSNRSFAARWGYDRVAMHGPWALKALSRRLHKDAVLVPWERITERDDELIRTDARRAELSAPPLLVE